MESTWEEISDRLKYQLSQYFSPMAVVFSTDNFQKMIQKYGLTPAEFLRPFGILKEDAFGKFSNFSEDPPVQLKHMKLNFYNNWDLEEIGQTTQ